MTIPAAEQFENIACYLCGSEAARDFISGEDDLTGKPGRFRFQRCSGCGLVYQRPRLRIEHIKTSSPGTTTNTSLTGRRPTGDG